MFVYVRITVGKEGYTFEKEQVESGHRRTGKKKRKRKNDITTF